MNGDVEITNNYITYTPDTDYFGDDDFSYTLSQGDKTASADVNITINSINDAPSIDVASTLIVSENQTAITTISISDVDEDELTLTLGGTDASSLNLSAENVLSFKEAPDYETKDNYSINLSLTDGTETTDKDISILITDINDVAPVFTSSASFNAPENQLAIGTVSASDEEDDELNFSISGEELAITLEGVLTFVSAPDFETKPSYSAVVTVSDGINEATQDITVNVTNVNDIAPVFTSETTFNAAENQTAIGTVTATDAEGDDVTFTVTGDELAITPIGTLTFVSQPDFETKIKYTATITASDGVNSSSQSIIVNVLDVDEIPPVISINGANPVTVELGSTYSDAGAIADGGETVSSESNVDTAKVGSYTVTYSATDAAGNTGTATRVVNVLDTTAPTITVIGDNPTTTELGLDLHRARCDCFRLIR
jgi:serralysin